eukprot:COSAG02_NODE_2176_length_9589_cov_4.787671_2_plen_191_part_00
MHMMSVLENSDMQPMKLSALDGAKKQAKPNPRAMPQMCSPIGELEPTISPSVISREPRLDRASWFGMHTHHQQIARVHTFPQLKSLCPHMYLSPGDAKCAAKAALPTCCLPGGGTPSTGVGSVVAGCWWRSSAIADIADSSCSASCCRSDSTAWSWALACAASTWQRSRASRSSRSRARLRSSCVSNLLR